MIAYDTKRVIQEHAKLINVSLPSSYRKGEMAEGLATFFHEESLTECNKILYSRASLMP